MYLNRLYERNWEIFYINHKLTVQRGFHLDPVSVD